MSEPARPRVIAVVNQKGGTAKTTTAVGLAVALAELGKRVVLIDLDPQGSATLWLGHSPTTMDLTEALTEGRPLESMLQPTKADGLELVPASRALAAADRQLSGEPGIQTALRDALVSLPPRDFVFIDCQPSLGLLSVMALAAAPEALVQHAQDPPDRTRRPSRTKPVELEPRRPLCAECVEALVCDDVIIAVPLR